VIFNYTQAGAVGLSLMAVLAWGTSDFLGGYAAREADAFVLTTVAHVSGALLMMTLALASASPFPDEKGIHWALLAGLSGGVALAIFYRALASGRMGLTAPVSAVLGAGIPTALGFLTQGFPGVSPIFGFSLAGLGIWLISRTEDGQPAEGIGLAIAAGCGFAGFYICAHEAGNGSAAWLAATQKFASFGLTGGVVLLRRNFRQITPRGILIGVVAGGLDVTGTFLFFRANQIGRLDQAVVLTSLYPAVTVTLARIFLREHFTRWKLIGILAALAAVPLIAS